MTNWEKYAGKFDTTEFGLIKGEPVLCNNIRCDECDWYDLKNEWVSERACSVSQMTWLKLEYNDIHEKRNTAKLDLLNVLSWNVLCTQFEYCANCPLHTLKEKTMDDVTCDTVLRTILLAGLKEVLEND